MVKLSWWASAFQRPSCLHIHIIPEFSDSYFHISYPPSVQISPLLREFRADTQGRSPEAGTDTEATKEYGLLACSAWLAQFAFLYTPGLLLRGITALSGMHLPIAMINQANSPHTC